MSEVIVITSGKGGVGKTTTSANLSMGLAQLGYKTVVIDFDVGLRNLDIVLGCERRVVFDFIHVINGEASLKQALIKDKKCDKLSILAASQTKDKEQLTKEGVQKIIEELRNMEFDYIICDSPAGIERGAEFAMMYADKAIVVANPEVSSVRDCDRVIGLLNSKTVAASEHGEIPSFLLITRYDTKRAANEEMISYNDIQEILNLDIIGIIPESSPEITKASNSGRPVVLENTNAGVAYQDLAKRISGTEVALKFTEEEKQSFLKRIFGGKNT